MEEFDKLEHDEIKQYLRLINESSKHGYNLLENLLEWSMAQTGRIKYNPQNINLYSIISENLSFSKNNAFSKNIDFSYEGGTDIDVYADKNMINTVIRNLLSNATKFTNTGGTIKIVVKEDFKNIELSIIDNGIGMDQMKISELFKIESNTSKNGTVGEKGSVLGLILCEEFIKINGGKIWIESEEGKGSIFTFSLPVGN